MVKVAQMREPARETFKGLGPTAQAVSELRKQVNNTSLVAGVIKGIALDRQGRVIVSQPNLTPLVPSKLSLMTPAATAAATTENQ